MTGLTGGKDGLRNLLARLVRWRVNIRWYAAALLATPLLALLLLLILSMFSPAFQPDIFHSENAPGTIFSGLAAALCHTAEGHGEGEPAQ